MIWLSQGYRGILSKLGLQLRYNRELLQLMMTLPFLFNHKLLPLEVLTSTNSLLCAKEWCCTVFYTRALCD
ncbi:hypothetical protein ACROYT_G031382 [Oculina patagonica]